MSRAATGELIARLKDGFSARIRVGVERRRTFMLATNDESRARERMEVLLAIVEGCRAANRLDAAPYFCRLAADSSANDDGVWRAIDLLSAKEQTSLQPLEPPAIGGVYFLLSRQSDLRVKIGYSAHDIARRRRQLQTAHPWPLDLIAYDPEAGPSDERGLHQQFSACAAEAANEWFFLSDEIRARIDALRKQLVARILGWVPRSPARIRRT